MFKFSFLFGASKKTYSFAFMSDIIFVGVRRSSKSLGGLFGVGGLGGFRSNFIRRFNN